MSSDSVAIASYEGGLGRLPVLELYKLRLRRKWSWRLIAANGQQLASGSQFGGFASARNAYLNAYDTSWALGGERGIVPHPSGVVLDVGLDIVTQREGGALALRIRRIS